jgi:hypothetical protein
MHSGERIAKTRQSVVRYVTSDSEGPVNHEHMHERLVPKHGSEGQRGQSISTGLLWICLIIASHNGSQGIIYH